MKCVLRRYRIKIVCQMRRQIFRQMKQKAKPILCVLASIFVKYDGNVQVDGMQSCQAVFVRCCLKTYS